MLSALPISFVVRSPGRSFACRAPHSTRLLDVLLAHPGCLPTVCGGGLTCGACHVAIIPGLHEALGPLEDELLDLADMPRRPGSRLACQVKVGRAMQGATVVVMSGRTDG